jgi:Raf kinase inhibitor-like YbhB/YbcL family protein
MQIRSPAFRPKEQIPVKYTCDGENMSPPLEWAGEPDGTRSFLLYCEDPDAPHGTFHHWIAYDIPPQCHRVDEGREAAGFPQALNDFGTWRYGGPCPPKGHGTHRYHFYIAALATDHLPVPEGASYREVLKAAGPFMLERAELVGVYERGN